MGDKADRQIEVLKMFGITAEKGFGIETDRIDIREGGYLGKGVSLITEDGEVKLSLTGWWANLEEATEHAQALNRGIAILEALKDTEPKRAKS